MSRRDITLQHFTCLFVPCGYPIYILIQECFAMRVFLVKKLHISSEPLIRAGGSTEEYKRYKFPNAVTSDTPGPGMERMSHILQRTLRKWQMDFIIAIPSNPSGTPSSPSKGYMELVGHSGCSLHAFNDISNGGATVTVQFIQDRPRNLVAKTSEMKILPSCGTKCVADQIDIPIGSLPHWNNMDELSGHLTILINSPFGILASNGEGNAKVGNLPRHILEEEVFSDVVIVAGNGAVVKAHRNFLAAQSSVFMKMFKTEMKEARERTVEMPDMSEEGVRAFLKFLYYQDIKDAVNDSATAFELFQAGHKYDVKLLEDKMAAIIMKKPEKWFKDTDTAVRLYMFTRKLVPFNKALNAKTVQILKMNSSTLRSCPSFQELFKKDADAAMDLCMSVFQVKEPPTV